MASASLIAGDDPPLTALLEQVAAQRANERGPTLFLRARAHPQLLPLLGSAGVCEQSFKPLAMALRRGGIDAVPCAAAAGRFKQVWLLPPRSREEARGLWARAVRRLAPGGQIIAAVANREGARSAESDLGALLGLAGQASKRKCRIFWSKPWTGALAEPDLMAAWTALDAPRRIEAAEIPERHFWSRPGLFAWDRIDVASRLLAASVPAGLGGRIADLGAGYGYLSMRLIEHCPALSQLDLYEAEAQAEAPAARNLDAAVRRAARPVAWHFHWHDVSEGLPARYDAIVSNPPFHQLQGRAELPALGRAFIDAAAAALLPQGRLWLVANRQLPYEQALHRRFETVREVVAEHGFKVIEARGPRHWPAQPVRDRRFHPDGQDPDRP